MACNAFVMDSDWLYMYIQWPSNPTF